MALPSEGTYIIPNNFMQVQGQAYKTSVSDTTLISAPGANKYIRLQKAIISVSDNNSDTVFALENGVGGDVIWRIASGGTDNDILGTYQIDFGDSGLKLSANTLLNFTVEGTDSEIQVCPVVVGVIEGN